MEIENFKYNLVASTNAIKGLNNVIANLQLARKTRANPPIGQNPDYNKNIAWEIKRNAEIEYENSVNKLRCCEIIPISWVPTFEEIKAMVNN